MKPSTVLVVGSGGREHALARRLLECESVSRVVVNEGNGGTDTGGLESRAGEALQVARSVAADLVVVGPEAPLCSGLVDELLSEGFVAYGPSRLAARLEGSKSFMKDFARRHGIATAKHVSVNDQSALDDALAAFASPPVIKAVGLCAGKGVVVADSFEQARQAAQEMLSGGAFGDAGRSVVIEERLYGQEVSVHAVCDGERAFILPPIQDHKRIGEGETGPNTGGMGTYGPAPIVTTELARVIELEIVERVVSGMASEGNPFKGTLFANVMVGDDGRPLLLEINVRFGDPETQVLMNLIDGDLARLLRSAALGNLDESSIRLNQRHGICVVLAARGYPETPRHGDSIEGIEEAERVPSVCVIHAGTRREGERLVTSGGRVLSVVATASTLREAHRRAYSACERIHFEGMQFRRDIGFRALVDAPPGATG